MPRKDTAENLRRARGHFDETFEQQVGTGATNIQLDPDRNLHEITAPDIAADSDFSLPDGQTLGQRVVVVCTARPDVENAVLTPDTALGFATVTFTGAGQRADLVWTSLGWALLPDGTVTVA
jgi:hypothetical protein